MKMTKRKCSYALYTVILFLAFNFSAMAQEDFVPAWSKKVVWYQVFPERFRNGDPSNDPTVKDVGKAYPHDSTSEWRVHPWESDWYELMHYEKQNGHDI